MADHENPQTISGMQRFIYLGLIPLVFTFVLIGTGLFLMQQGKGDSFAKTLVQAGSSVVSEGKKLTGAAFGNQDTKPASAANGQSRSAVQPSPNTPTASGQPSNAGGTSNPQMSSNTPANTGSASNQVNQAAPTQTSSLGNSSSVPGSSATPADPAEVFKQKTTEMAKMYSTMSASKAAPIIGNMSIKDAVFTMLDMNAQQRAVILAQMDPKQAASLSKELQMFPPGSADTTTIQNQLGGLADSKQALDEIVKSYAQMPPQSAAVLIAELMKTDEKKAISIMTNLDAAARAQILTAMSNNKSDPNSIKYAAAITGILAKT